MFDGNEFIIIAISTLIGGDNINMKLQQSAKYM